MKSFIKILLLVSVFNLIACSKEKEEPISPFVGHWVPSLDVERFDARALNASCASLLELKSISSAGLLTQKTFIDGKVRNVNIAITAADGKVILNEALYRASLLTEFSEELKQLTVEQRAQVDQDLSTVIKTAADQFNGQKLKFSLSEDTKAMEMSRGDGVESSQTGLGFESEFTKVDESKYSEIVELHTSDCQ